MKISVIGGGSWGTALAVVLGNRHPSVSLSVRSAELREAISAERVNHRYLPGVRIPAHVLLPATIQECIAGADVILFAVPSQGMEETLSGMADPGNTVCVSAAKGFDPASGMTMSELFAAKFPDRDPGFTAVLSGPNIALEIGQGYPAACVVASASPRTAGAVQSLFASTALRCYTSNDVLGVELGGALKNVVAIAAGACDGLEIGDNAKSAVITRGLAEMVRFGSSKSLDPLTFAGLSGVGDCIVTCMSVHSRNRRLGEELGRGVSIGRALETFGGMVVEGVATSRTLVEVHRIDAEEYPLASAVYGISCRGDAAVAKMEELMSRAQGEELRGIRYT